MKTEKNIKTLLFENMAKLNPDFKLSHADNLIIESENKWIQKAVNPEHAGYCTPESKPTCTPRRKALAHRFKKGIENEEFNLQDVNNDYKIKAEKLKEYINILFRNQEYDMLDGLYRLLVNKKKSQSVANSITENNSEDYRIKTKALQEKIDSLFETNQNDIIDKITEIMEKLNQNTSDKTSITETPQNDTYFETLSEALDAVRTRVEKRGFTVDEDDMFNQFGTGGINYGETRRATIHLLKNGIPDKRRTVTIAIYRMDSGKYELTAYLN